METIVKPDYQITIPFEVRKKLDISINDKVDWKVQDNKVVMMKKKSSSVKKKLNLKKLNSLIKVSPGKISDDIEQAKQLIAVHASK